MSSLPEPTGERRPVLPPARRDGNAPAPQAPQRVSVDEMLTQLRNPEGGRRKRRSEQPVYKKRRKRRLWILILGAVTVLALGGYFGFRWFQRYRLEGDTFRQSLNRHISSVLECDVEFTRIHDGGAGSLAAREAEVATRGMDLIESAKLTDVSANLTSRSWMSNEWGITALSIGGGTIKLNPNRPPATAGAPEVPAAAGSNDESRMSISPEPRLITIDAIRVIGGLDIEWPDGTAVGKTEGIRKLVGGPKVRTGGVLDGSFINGEISLRGMSPLKLNQVTWKLTGRHLEIPGGRITAGPGIQMEIKGKADLVPDGAVTLNVDIVETQLASLFPAWSERISGALEAKDGLFQAGFGKGPERTFSGDFKVKGALLSGMGFLAKLAQFLDRHDFSALEFSSLSGHFSWSPSGGMVLTKLFAERDSFLRLEGDVTVSSGGELKGRLKVSVADQKLKDRAKQNAHPFVPGKDEGWSVMEFIVSGTAGSVNDTIRMEGLNFAEPRGPGVQPPQQGKPRAPGASDLKKAEDDFQDLIQQPK